MGLGESSIDIDFDYLDKKYRSKFIRLAKSRLNGRSKNEAEDLVQECYFKLLRLSYKPDSVVDYIAVSIINAAKNRDGVKRWSTIDNAVDIDLVIDDVCLYDSIHYSELEDKVINDACNLALSLAHPATRETLKYWMDGLSYKEIADIRCVSIKTVENCLSSYFKKIRSIKDEYSLFNEVKYLING